MGYSVLHDSPVIHLWCFLCRKNQFRSSSWDTSVTHLHWCWPCKVATLSWLRWFPWTPRDWMTTTSAAFFMSCLCKQRRRSQRGLLGSSGVLTGRSLQATWGSPGKSGEVLSLKTYVFTTQKEKENFKKAVAHRAGLNAWQGTKERALCLSLVQPLVLAVRVLFD